MSGHYPDISGTLVDQTITQRTVQRSFANPSGAGAAEVVAAQGDGIRIRVLAIFVLASADVSVKFLSAASDISATFAVPANGGMVMPEAKDGWFQTAPNEALNINLGDAIAVGVQVIWIPTV